MSTLFLFSYGVLWFLVAALVLLMLLVLRQFGLVYLKTAGGVSRGGAPLGTKIPDVELPTTAGQPVHLSDYAGQALLLFFTSPHCAPCQQLKPELEKFLNQSSRYPGLTVMVLSMDAPLEESIRFTSGLNCTVAALPDQEMYRELFGGEVTPFAFLLNEQREVVAKGLVNRLEDIENILKFPSRSALDPIISAFSQTAGDATAKLQ